jgi:hypothetical protein
MTRNEFLARLALAAVLTPVARYVPLLWGDPALWWWVAALVALCLVFLGELLWDAFMGNDT